MGSLISLGINQFEIDWGKNNLFAGHSALFLPSDVVQMPYYYTDGVFEMKEGLSRSLGSIKNRLDLLGYSPKHLPDIYMSRQDSHPDCLIETPLSFEEFRNVLLAVDLSEIQIVDEVPDYDFGEFASRCIFSAPEVRRHLPERVKVDRDLGMFFENMDPYLTLRLLAENERNADRCVQWRFADVVENGWAERDDIVCPLSSALKILVVTEGSSDTYVIERAIAELYPDIADMFDFIDMRQNYPFTGVGNLYNFCQGLARIGIQNKVLVVFDNDAAGV